MIRKILFFAVLTWGCAYSQNLPEAFYSTDRVYFYGIDFSEVRAFGDGFENPQDVVTRYFPDMNTYYAEHKDGNCLFNLFKGKKLLFDGTEVLQRIKGIDPGTLVSQSARDYEHLNEQIISQLVGGLKKTTDGSFGFIIIMEDLNKTEAYGSMWPALFNCDTGEILYTARFKGMPGGFGLKRYWLGAVDDAVCQFGRAFNKQFNTKKK